MLRVHEKAFGAERKKPGPLKTSVGIQKKKHLLS